MLTQRQQQVPRTVMGTAMLARSPATAAQLDPPAPANGGPTAEESPPLAALPATLEEFSRPPAEPRIHDPPPGPDNPKETAPQRFKKGNLRLLQTDDGGWKLEELESKRRSLESAGGSSPKGSGSPKDSSFEEGSAEEKTASAVLKPPAQPDRRRKKSAGKAEEGGHKESQLLRRYAAADIRSKHSAMAFIFLFHKDCYLFKVFLMTTIFVF